MVEVRCEQLAHGYSALTAGRWVNEGVVFRAGTHRAGVATCAVRLAMVLWWLEFRNSSSIRRMSWYTVLPRSFTRTAGAPG